MIHIFRKIRKNLFTENNTGKPASRTGRYLKYALGEIFLVVVGILIALSINNWNESRKQSASEKEFIVSVKNDLEQDKAFIELIIDLIEPRIDAYKIFNSDLAELYSNDRKKLESIFKDYFKAQRTFYPISGSYESAVSGNQITVFRNKELIQKIIKLYNSTYNRLIDNGEILDDRWAFLSRKYSYERRTGKLREMNTKQQSEFLNDVYHHYIQMEWYLTQLNMAIIEIDGILKS